MSVAADSPLHSSSSSGDNDFAEFHNSELDCDDDFAAFLDLELECDDDAPPNIGVEGEEEGEKGKGKREVEEYEDLDHERSKRQKVDISESLTRVAVEAQNPAMDRNICDHPIVYEKLCGLCGQRREDDESDVSLRHIKGIRVASQEADRLREKDLKYLHRQKKLILVLDLDHTLLNSTFLNNLNEEEKAYLEDGLTDAVKNSLHRLDKIGMLTKLRPFVHTFLKEASKLFEMYIDTMGDESYAMAMANLLDPKGLYFQSRVIANDNVTKRDQKSLDVVLGKESAVLILDDTEQVWEGHRENLILMDRYHFFSSKQTQQSLSERRSDENESDGALATVLRILQKVHSDLFDEKQKESLENRDVRQVLENVRKEVLKGCKIVFSRVFHRTSRPENQHYWKLAEQLGAICVTETDSSVTHVISKDAGTEKSQWAVQEEKFLVNPSWIDAARYLWKRPPEANYTVLVNVVRKEVLRGCKIVFSGVFRRSSRPEKQHYWKLAEQLGAICVTETDSSVTHVISKEAGTEKSQWAVREKKFLVNPNWIDAAQHSSKRQPEANFPVSNLRSL